MSQAYVHQRTARSGSLGLKARLLIPILGVVLLTLLGSVLAVVHTAERSLLESSREKILNSAVVVGNSILEQINRAKADILFATSVPDIAGALDPSETMHAKNREEFITLSNALLLRLSEVCGYYETFYVTNDKGVTLASSLPSSVGTLDISNRAWFHEAMTGKGVVLSNPFISRITGDALMAIANKFTHNGYNGAMVGSLQIKNITRNALEAENRPWLQTFIVTKEGVVVAAINDAVVTKNIYGAVPWFAAMTELPLVYKEIEVDGIAKVASSYRLPGTPLYALAIADRAYLLAPVRTVKTIGAVTIALALLLAFGVIYRTVNPAVKDIYRLAAYAENVGQGNLDLQPGVLRSDELGALSTELQKMVDKLRLMIVKAEEGTRAKSDFLARMSHEIRTPMNAIIGMTYLGLRGSIDEKDRARLEKIQTAAQNLLAIINDILDFSKVEAGKMMLEEAPFRLSAMLQSMHDLLELKAREKNLVFSYTVADNVPDMLIGDSLRLSQVCINLCTNAIKFTERGRVSLHVAVHDTQDKNLLLHFTVRDTGIGMSQEEQERIFDAFSQADGSTTRKFGGTGLGLAICKLLVKLMQGELWVESSPQAGSVFHFTAMVSRADGTSVSSGAELPLLATDAPLTDARVLVVEDNELNREIAHEMIVGMGITPEMAKNGEEALKLCAKRQFDLILMDIQMPVMDGLEATRRIRAEIAWATNVPIIAMTANAMAGDREKSIAAGMNAHITKPIDHEELRQSLAHWTRKAAQTRA